MGKKQARPGGGMEPCAETQVRKGQRTGSYTQGVARPLPTAHRLSGHTRQNFPGEELNSNPIFSMQESRKQEWNYHRDNPEFVLISENIHINLFLILANKVHTYLSLCVINWKQSQVLQERTAIERHLCAMLFNLQLCFQYLYGLNCVPSNSYVETLLHIWPLRE